MLSATTGICNRRPSNLNNQRRYLGGHRKSCVCKKKKKSFSKIAIITILNTRERGHGYIVGYTYTYKISVQASRYLRQKLENKAGHKQEGNLRGLDCAATKTGPADMENDVAVPPHAAVYCRTAHCRLLGRTNFTGHSNNRKWSFQPTGGWDTIGRTRETEREAENCRTR